MEKEKSVEISIGDLFRFVIKRVWIILLAALVVGAAAFAVCSYFMTPQYVATARLYVLKRDRQGNDLAYSDIQIATQLAKDYMMLISGRNFTEKVLQELSLNMSVAQLSEKVTVSSPGSGDTRVLQVNVRDEDPLLAARIADCVCEVAVNEVHRIMDAEVLNVVYDAEVPSSPSSPRTGRNTLLAALFGAFGAFAVLFVIFIMDDRIKTEEDVERYLNLNTVGTIPYCAGLETVGASKGTKRRRRIG